MVARRKTIWVLETHEGVNRTYREALGLRFNLKFFANFEILRRELNEVSNLERPDLLIAEIAEDGIPFFDYIRASKEPVTVPFIIVSVVDDIEVMRSCFHSGASDYLIKPFKKPELVTKTERVVQQALQTERSDNPAAGDYDLDPINLTISRDQRTSDPLTLKEYQILSVLRKHSVDGCSRDFLRQKIWGNLSISHKALDVHLFNLRKKIKAVGLEVLFEPKIGRYFLSLPRISSEPEAGIIGSS